MSDLEASLIEYSSRGVRFYDYDADRIYSSGLEFALICARGERRTVDTFKITNGECEYDLVCVFTGDRTKSAILQAYECS